MGKSGRMGELGSVWRHVRCSFHVSDAGRTAAPEGQNMRLKGLPVAESYSIMIDKNT